MVFLELQSRFGDTPVKSQVVCPKLSRKRDCSPKRVKDQIIIVFDSPAERTSPLPIPAGAENNY